MESWMVIDRDGNRRVVDLRTRTRRGVRDAVARATKAGQTVLSAHLGGPGPIALLPRVFP